MSKEGERQFPAVAKLRYHRQNDEKLETLRNSDIISPHPPIINHFCVKMLIRFHSNYMTLSIINITEAATLDAPVAFSGEAIPGRIFDGKAQVDAHREMWFGLGSSTDAALCW